MEGKNGELAKLKESMNTDKRNAPKLQIKEMSVKAENVPVEESATGWRVEMPIAKSDSVPSPAHSGQEEAAASISEVEGDTKEPFNSDKAPEVTLGESDKDSLTVELNKAVEDVKEGDVSSIASHKVVYGAARDALVGKQERDVSDLQGKRDPEHDPSVEDLGYGPSYFDENGKLIKPKEAPTAAATEETPTERGLAYEKARTEWKEARDRSHKLEQEYDQKYKEHIEQQSKGWRYFANMPRRMFGFKPKLTPELEALQGASVIARREYKDAGAELLKQKDIQSRSTKSPVAQVELKEYSNREKVEARYQRMLAYHLVTGVHRRRLEKQKEGAMDAWKESKVLRPVMETLGKHKYATMAATAVGATVLTGGAFGVVAAGMATGLGVGLGTHKLLDKTWVNSARKKLAEAQSGAGKDFFESSFLEADKEMEYLTHDVESRKAVSKTTSTIAGVAAGAAAAGYAGGLNTESGVVIDTPVPPENADVVPPAPEVPVVPETVPPVEPEVVAPADPETAAPVEPEVTPPAEAEPPAAVPPESAVEVPPDISHTVVKGDNVWNILEGKGPDANPVGGKSEVLRGMELADRQAALDKLVEYYEAHPEEAKAVGVVKSNGDIHKIYPGEELNISMFDDKLCELLGIEGGLSENVPIPEPRPEAVASEVPVPELQPDVADAVTPEVTPPMSEAVMTDLNEMRIQEVLDLQRLVIAGDTEALERLDSLGMDPGSLQEMVNTIFERGEGPVNGDLTVGEYLNSTRETPAAPIVETPNNPVQDQPVPETTPYGDYDPFQDNSARVSEASASAVEVSDTAVRNYVADIEKGTRGLIFAGQPDVSGTFDLLKDLQFDQMKSLAASGQLPEGVSQDGWDRWVNSVNESVKKVPPAGEGETLGQYVARVANTRVA